MTLKEKCCRGVVFGSRFLAVLTLFPALMQLPALVLNVTALFRPPFREMVVMMGLLALLAYSVIVLLPLEKVSAKTFMVLSSAGTVLALMSLNFTGMMYWGVIVDLLQGKLVYHMRAGAVLLFFYSYLPLVVCLRRLSPATMTCPADGGQGDC